MLAAKRLRWALPVLAALATTLHLLLMAVVHHHRQPPAPQPAAYQATATTVQPDRLPGITPVPVVHPTIAPTTTPATTRPPTAAPRTSLSPRLRPRHPTLQASAHTTTQAAGRSYDRPALHPGSARAYAASLMAATQFSCFDAIVTRESGWSVTAQNPTSGAYGLMQALPGSKMAAFGADWRTNPVTQIRWGISYIHSQYGTPCGAWDFWQAHGWY